MAKTIRYDMKIPARADQALRVAAASKRVTVGALVETVLEDALKHPVEYREGKSRGKLARLGVSISDAMIPRIERAYRVWIKGREEGHGKTPGPAVMVSQILTRKFAT